LRIDFVVLFIDESNSTLLLYHSRFLQASMCKRFVSNHAPQKSIDFYQH
jgi:hypothetical protein